MLKLSSILRTLLSSVTLSLLLAAGTGCKDSSQSQGVGWQPNVPFGTLPPGFDSFPERWNKQVNDRLAREEAAKQKEIKNLRDQFFKEEDPKIREKLQSKLIADEAALSVIHRRQTEGDYIKFKTPADIPQDLKWEDGLDNPEIGDPNAKKGGVLRQWAPGSYPDTFRPNGPNSNSGFRGPLYDEIIIGLVSIHPVTGKIIPGIAHKWAETADRRTVYFELDPDARYTDGAKVKAIDLLVNMYIRTSEYSRDVFYNNFFYQNASNITIYDDSRFSITLPFAKPLLPYYCTLFIPSPPHFYCEFGPSYVERYQWRVPPTTGAYVVKPDGIIRGRQVTLQRVPDWWARDKKFTKYMYNVDQIVYNFIAEPSKAIELFRIGELDVMNITKPELWHERMEIPEVHNGYINRSTFYTIYPRPPYGLFLNTSKSPFNNLDVRLGFQYALNIQNIIDITFRGDYQRLNSYNSGFGKFTNPYIKARPYSPEQARACFAKAGYTIPCPDGILRKPDGTRLTAAITFPNSSPSLASTLGKLKEDARKCGLEIQLDPLDSTVAFRKIMEKRVQASFMAWGFTPPHPMNEQGFHSRYAYDERGSLTSPTPTTSAPTQTRRWTSCWTLKRTPLRKTNCKKPRGRYSRKFMMKPCGFRPGPRNSSGWATGAGSGGQTAPPRNSAIPSYLTRWKATCTGWTTTSRRRRWKPSVKEKPLRKWTPCTTSTATWTPSTAWTTRKEAENCRPCLSSRKTAPPWNPLKRRNNK